MPFLPIILFSPSGKSHATKLFRYLHAVIVVSGDIAQHPCVDEVRSSVSASAVEVAPEASAPAIG
jgi:hypothetical protein